ncbi:hypothetical protein NPX13_g2077 [Xylaria arbuscula]|uniref:Uncharacterized protein n=1 Tax=Xylaria arbuscula TaxID=114810 RepID=A0A9W8NLE7_9PEZI|nr:hypothetical protein NPX13_g2077 [Xylaria arbuscula]
MTASSTRFFGKICDGGKTSYTPFALPTPTPNGYDTEEGYEISQIVLIAPLFQLHWQSHDRLPVSTEESSAKESGDETIPRRLPTSAKAGIGVGVSAALFGLLALVWLILKRRRSKLSHEKPPAADVHCLASGFIGEERYELSENHTEGYQERALEENVVVLGSLSPVDKSYQEETAVGTQEGQRMTDGPYEMPDRI